MPVSSQEVSTPSTRSTRGAYQTRLGYPPAVDDPLARHLRTRTAEVAGLSFRWTAGCRGHPLPPAGWDLLVEAARDLEGEVLDASACFGLPGRAVRRGRVTVLEPSAAGLAAARLDLEPPASSAGSEAAAGDAGVVRLAPGLPWDAAMAAYDHVLSAPPAERGSARVRAELAAASRALVPGGTAWLLLEKDRGAKRYEKEAADLLGRSEVVARSRGWRLSRVTRERGAEAGGSPAARAGAPGPGDAPWLEFDTPLGRAHALPGTHAAGKLDPGTAVLLAALGHDGPERKEARVLDLGCGWGPLSRWAAEGGGRVTAADDDLAAVRSTRRNVPAARVLHSDLTTALPDGERFDLVLVNPPFHLGAGVRMALPAAFLAAAAARVVPEGEVWVVANEALPYEAGLAEAGMDAREVRRERGFKVLRARPRRRR